VLGFPEDGSEVADGQLLLRRLLLHMDICFASLATGAKLLHYLLRAGTLQGVKHAIDSTALRPVCLGASV
jgi:hypothetical protein